MASRLCGGFWLDMNDFSRICGALEYALSNGLKNRPPKPGEAVVQAGGGLRSRPKPIPEHRSKVAVCPMRSLLDRSDGRRRGQSHFLQAHP